MRTWLGVFLIVCSASVSASAAEIIGHAAAIINRVDARLGATVRALQTRDDVHFQELIRASTSGNGQFLLNDGSKLVVGPGGILRLDSFVYSGSSAKSVTLSTIKGAFRFISGNAKSTTYSVRTPVAIIGLRGTAFDFYVEPSGATSVMLLSGAVQVCGTGRQCRTLRNPCEAVRVSARGVSPVQSGARQSAALGISYRRAFPFLYSQTSLLQSFRRRGLRACGSSVATANPAPTPNIATAPAPAPAPAPSPPGGRFGNPGNNSPVGRAGESPNGGFFGLGVVGRGDVGQGNNGPAGIGPGGVGPGGDGPGGSGPGGNGPGGNGPGGNGPGGNGPGGNGPGGNGPGGNGPGGNGPGGNGPGGNGPGR